MVATSPSKAESQVRVAGASRLRESNERTNGRTDVASPTDRDHPPLSATCARVQAEDVDIPILADVRTCSEEQCNSPVHGKGLCSAHHAKRWRAGRVCAIPDCGRPLSTKGLCSGHYARSRKGADVASEPLLERRGSLEERFWKNVDKTDYCWVWTGGISPAGYGRYGRKYAHRLSYEFMVGPIPDGLQLDHLCRNRGCCNPDHLEPVTCLENQRRSPFYRKPRGAALVNALKTHCKRGHEFTPENTLPVGDDGRRCRECERLRAAECERPVKSETDAEEAEK